MTYRHLVLFRVHDHVPEPDVQAAEQALAGLGALPGVVEWTVRRSDDDRKGRIVVENGLFDDADALAAWRDLPEHRAVGERMREIADWWIGDYPEPRV